MFYRRKPGVIEGKEILNYEAIGQLLVYKDTLEEDYPQLGRLRMGIICIEGDERLESTCENHRIDVFKVGPPFIDQMVKKFVKISRKWDYGL